MIIAESIDINLQVFPDWVTIPVISFVIMVLAAVIGLIIFLVRKSKKPN
jgi:hypothetical protein